MTRWIVCALLLWPMTPGLSTAADAADSGFFEQKVRPILVERCFRCHSRQAKKQRGGLYLDSRAALLQGGDRGAAVVSRQPDRSLLIQAVRHEHGEVQMPPPGKLPPQEIAALEDWVRRGLPFPGKESGVEQQQILQVSEGRRFWSFQPPRLITPPTVKDPAWPLRRIDALLLAARDKRRLASAPPASHRILIRRAMLDLVGLPPTAEQVEAFVQDATPDAYGKLIDRLLTSPQHGERWGRMWLDLTRYCDVTESWNDVKGSPWLYRDWVVRAMNEDLPFDRFVQMQLAADSMPDAKPTDLAALGFLGLSPNYWKELKLDPEVIKTVVAEEWEERIGAVTSAVLGLTVACARCHDHKFDPITAQDYYALAGVFASIRPIARALLPEREAFAVEEAQSAVRSLQQQASALRKKTPLSVEVSKQIEELEAKIATLRRSTPHFESPLALVVEDASLRVLPDGAHKTKLEYERGVGQDVAVQQRGNPSSIGPVVPRRFLEVLSAEPPRRFTQGSGRLELARALVTGGGPLASRVIVNRIWKQHFGTGLVETPNDFGTQGARPSHPELLDDLAARFMAAGWSLKWLHREIMLSATYQQSSMTHVSSAIDPDNRLLGRMNRRRLEIEAWRDAMLSVTGTLNLQLGGAPLELDDVNNQRRTIYGVVRRYDLHNMLRLNDFPEPTAPSGARVATTTPLQQLFVLNSPFIQQQAAALARRLKAEVPESTEPRVQRAYLLLFGRAATAAQMRLAIAFLTPDNDGHWEQYCQALLGSNEFLFVD